MSITSLTVDTTAGSTAAVLSGKTDLVANTKYSIYTGSTGSSIPSASNITFTTGNVITPESDGTYKITLSATTNVIAGDDVPCTITYSTNIATVFVYTTGGVSAANSLLAKSPDFLSKNFSDPVVKENHDSTSYVSGSTGIAQEFYLPSNYMRGDQIPNLTGFQVRLNISNTSKKVKYALYRYDDQLVERRHSDIPITAASGSGSAVTYTTGLDHNLAVGQYVSIIGFDPVGYNGRFQITEVSNSKTFKTANTTISSVTTYGKVSGPSITANTKVFDGKTYYEVNRYKLMYQFAQRESRIRNTNKENSIWTYVTTGLAPDIKKGSLVSIKYTTNNKFGWPQSTAKDYSVDDTNILREIISVSTKNKRTPTFSRIGAKILMNY